MGKIGYGYGSEWQLLRCLGYHRRVLNNSILKAIRAITSGFAEETNEAEEETRKVGVHWLDRGPISTLHPLRNDREYRGISFNQPMHIFAVIGSQWAEYWPAPASGTPPQWDAVARLSTYDWDRGMDPEGEWLLVEAKAHLGEMETQCRATDPNSLEMIGRAMEATAKAVTHQGKPTNAWMEKYYQYANRLAVLNFLCQYDVHPGQSARLIFLYFYGESEEAMPNCKCPQSAAEWQTHIDKVNAEMDLDPQSALMQRVHHIFLPANPKVMPMKP